MAFLEEEVLGAVFEGEGVGAVFGMGGSIKIGGGWLFFFFVGFLWIWGG